MLDKQFYYIGIKTSHQNHFRNVPLVIGGQNSHIN